MPEQQSQPTTTPRPPVIAILGHVDHGKSTLLDRIRQAKTERREAGGITQHVAAYEIAHTTSDGAGAQLTFIDTPGHAAFRTERARGARIADMAILIISAEEGIKEQTKESLVSIKEAGVPFVVAINKIDRPNANPDKVKQELAEEGVFVEGYGGDVSCASVSAATGEGISDLLDILVLTAELLELTAEPDKPGSGFVLESHVDPRAGIEATLIVKDGTLKTGSFLVIGGAVSRIRRITDYTGRPIHEAAPSQPACVIGLSELPGTGALFVSCEKKQSAEELARAAREKSAEAKEGGAPVREAAALKEHVILPVVLKADVHGSLEAVKEELARLESERVKVRILEEGVGLVTENDIRTALDAPGSIILAFNAKTDKHARELARTSGIEPAFFDVIYKLAEYVEREIARRTPRITTLEEIGRGRIIRKFSSAKNTHLVGCSILSGTLTENTEAKLVRNDTEIAQVTIGELQERKIRVKSSEAGSQVGVTLTSKTTPETGDILVAVVRVEK